jgi:hypothetical protein
MALLPWLSGSDGSITRTLGMVTLGFMIFTALAARHRHPEGIPLVLVFSAFIFDAPWGRAFYDYTPMTETMGGLFFSSMAKSLGIPGMSVSIFEGASIGLAALMFYRRRYRDTPPSKASQHDFQAAMWVAIAIPAAAAFGVAQGVARGNDLGSALTQTRAMISLPVWFFIGWCLGTSPRVIARALLVVSGCMLVKSLQGLYVYWRVWGRDMGEHIFLIEHLTSDYILTAALFLTGLVVWYLRDPIVRLGILALIAPMGAAFALNNRRSAIVGLVFSLAFGVLAMPRGYLLRHSAKIGGVILAGVLYLTVTWEMEGPLGFPSRAIESIVFAEKESSRDYRDLENSNLYAGLEGNVLLGMGFGTRFPLVFKMDDISSVYANFDLIPHNTMIFLWAFVGPVGIAAFAAFIAMNMAMVTRIVRAGSMGLREILALVGLTMIVRWSVFVYSDIGLLEIRSLALLGLVLGGLWRMAPRIATTGEVG